MKIARPAARKTTGQRAKSAKGGTSRQSKSEPRKAEPASAVQERQAAQPARRKFVELPKVQGELPTPTATFYF